MSEERTTSQHRWEISEGNYFLSHHVPAAEFEATKERVTELLKAQGFGILTVIDVAKTMKEKLGEDLAPYVILGACNPPLALRGLSADPGIGALLPCNVVVAQEANGVFVGSVDPVAMFSVVQNDEMKPLAEEVKSRLVLALSGLAA